MAISCLHVTVIPLSLLAFIFFVVALVSNHWVTISKCWNPANLAATTTLEYNQGLFQKCTSGTCENIMAGPPAALKTSGYCGGKGNNWFVKDAYCQSYAKCENGVTLEEGTCTGTQQFDLYTRKCTSARPNCCHDIRCKPKVAADPKKVVSDVLCSGWNQCKLNAQTRLLDYSSGSCPSGQWFDQSANPRICVGTKPASCADTECVESGKRVSKVVVTDKPTCENYYKCINGKKQTAVTCTNVQSAKLTLVSGTQCTTNLPTPDEKICQSPVCKADANPKITDPTKKQCQTYHTCSSKMITRNQQCTGTSTSGTPYFHETDKACVAQAKKPASCKTIECVNRVPTGVADYKVTDGTTCQKYTQCSGDGMTYTATGTCSGTDTIKDGTAACSNSQKDPVCKNPKCLNKAVGWHLNPDDKKCKTYFRCGAGETLLTAETTCPGTTVFVKGSGTCQSTTASGSTTCFDPRCTALDSTHLKVRTDAGMNGLVVTSTDGKGRKSCHAYWECNLGFFTQKDCGPRSFYNTATAQCTTTRPTGSPNDCRDPDCKGKADGKYGTDGADCLTYMVCLNELKTTTGTCGKTTGGVQKLIDSTAALDCVDPSAGLPSGCAVKVDGGWSPWSLYSACSLNTTYNPKIDVGVTSRSRTCTCPSKKGTGADCPGVNAEYSTCYSCSPEKGWLMGARAGLALAMACSIMTLLWAIWCCYSMKCYASHAVIFHTFVSVIGGLVGAIMANGNKPDLSYTCEVKSGWGFIMAILGVILAIITHIIAIVISVKGRNRVQSAEGCKMQERNKKNTEETNPTYNE